jgi:hypothetical protein
LAHQLTTVPGDDRATPAAGSSDAAVPPRTLSRQERLVFTVLTLVMAWLLLEVGGYFVYWVVFGRPFSWRAMQDRRRERVNRSSALGTGAFAQVHPYVGYVEEPREDSGVHRLVDGQPVPVSSFGYMDDRPPIQTRGPDRVVVGITGGSVACLFAINGTRRLEAELAGHPTFAGKRFVFVNLALAGYKQPQQLMTLGYLMTLGAEFDIILNIDGFNEVALHELENASHKVFPAFPRSWQARIGVNDSLAGITRGRVLVVDEKRAALARAYSSAPWRYSVLANLVWHLRDRWLEGEAVWASEIYVRRWRPSGAYAVTGPKREFASPDELYDHLAAIWANSSSLMDQLCRGRGTRYFHFLQPNQYVRGTKPMSPAETRVAIMDDHPYRSGVALGYPRLQRAGQSLITQGVAFHDLTRIFADHPEPIYTDSCCHYNQAGYEIMAQAIASSIVDDGGSHR